MLIKRVKKIYEVTSGITILFASASLTECQKFVAANSNGALIYSKEYAGVFTPGALKRGGVYEGARKDS